MKNIIIYFGLLIILFMCMSVKYTVPNKSNYDLPQSSVISKPDLDFYNVNVQHTKKDSISNVDLTNQFVEQAIFEYVEFSKAGEFIKIKDLTISPKELTRELKSDTQNKYENEVNSSVLEPQSSTANYKLVDEYAYQNLIKEFPILINKVELKITNYSMQSFNEKHCIIKIDFASRKLTNLESMDFYLLNIGNNSWKIYKIKFSLDK